MSIFVPIRKPPADRMAVRPNLDYDRVRGEFEWEKIYAELDWLPSGSLNMAHEAIDRHADGPGKDRVAMIWRGRHGQREEYTFAQLKGLSGRFANLLRSLGVDRGDRVCVFMDRVPEQYIALLGTLKVGAVACPLFAALDPGQVKRRLQETGAMILVTHPRLRRKISGIIPELFELQHIVAVNRHARDPEPVDPADLSYDEEMDKASSEFSVVPTSQLDQATISYTSGATGEPRGVVHRHQAVAQHYATGRWVLDLHPDDVYWCTADPGWATGTSYGMLAPWTNGVAQVIYEGGFGASAWFELIQEQGITVWYTAPTAIRMLMKAGDELPRRYDLSSLRHVCSVGQPLSAEAVMWGRDVLGVPFHDTWWQTETGAILCANYPGMDIRPGSMGKPVPGVELAILDREYNRAPLGTDGVLAVRPGWPSMFADYWKRTDVYNSRFKKGWYISGDMARMDDDGYFWSAGRADD